jgi:hypothetical protein
MLALTAPLGCVGVIGDPAAEAEAGVVIHPSHGGELPAPGARLEAHGYHARPAEPLRLELRSGDLWRPIALTHSSRDPYDAADALRFRWSVALPRAWQEGAVARLRVVDGSGRALVGFDHDAGDCLGTLRSSAWTERARACGTFAEEGMWLVSTAPTPLEGTDRPRLLERKGSVGVEETAQYYAASAAPERIEVFRERYCFGAGDEVVATYYNGSDLAIARAMHCARCPEARGATVACYVSNHGEFGGAPAEAIAGVIDGHPALATVAMVFDPAARPEARVRFMVYDARGELAPSVALDSFGDNRAVPSTCLNCHGGRSVYDPESHSVRSARFLAFDPAALRVAQARGVERVVIEEALRRLNAMIREAASTPAVGELLAGLYPAGLDAVGAASDPDFVPTGWRRSAADESVYRHVVAPYCRSCHVSFVTGAGGDPLDFRDADGWRAAGGVIARVVCDPAERRAHGMPNAEAPLRRFWSGPARAYLARSLALDEPCGL